MHVPPYFASINQQYEIHVIVATKLLGDLIHKLSAGSLNCENELSIEASLSSSN